MPPRRSAAAAAAKRAAEDLTDEADDAKRHKADGEPMAAAASSAAAAAASNSSSAGAAAAAAAASSPSQRSDAALAAAAAAIPLPDSLDCPICDESFPAAECKEKGGAGRVPRSLFCSPKPHTYCTGCLERLLQRGVDKQGKPRIFVRCSLCQFEHELHPQQPPASSAAAAAAVVRLIPINASLMESISRGQQLERMVREQQQQLQKLSAIRCTYPDCQQSALIWCNECDGELCAAHDRDLHPEAAAAAAASSSAAHRRIPLSERTSARHAQMAARLAANGAKLRANFLGLEKKISNRAESLAALLVVEFARFERDVLEPIRSQIAVSQAAELAIKAISAKISALSDTELLKHESRINQLIGPAMPLDGLLAALSADRRSDLERFLQAAGVSLDRVRSLLYRGSRDGFRREDFMRSCTGYSDTLTIVGPHGIARRAKVKDNGYVFGAYTHCQWPSADSAVPDPTGKSFLFSLVNGSGNAVRFSLRDKDRAIEVHDGGILFGATKVEGDTQTGWPNFVLMRVGSADEEYTNASNEPKQGNSSYQPDDDQVCDETFLADQQSFAAEEIEVFQL